jgi:HAD superfamily hydrolase (TIGR01509 family)
MHKPRPEPYLKAIQSLGIPSEQILVFEDSEIGRASAVGANLSVITIETKRNLN